MNYEDTANADNTDDAANNTDDDGTPFTERPGEPSYAASHYLRATDQYTIEDVERIARAAESVGECQQELGMTRERTRKLLRSLDLYDQFTEERSFAQRVRAGETVDEDNEF